MRSDILKLCVSHLAAQPPQVDILTPLTQQDVGWFTRNWPRHRFLAQQDSILYDHPDDPLYGRGLLWHYELQPQDTADGTHLSIVRTPRPEPTIRGLILLASVSERPVPFLDRHDKPYPSRDFYIVRQRLLGEARNRRGVALPLRPAIRTVQLTTYGGQPVLRAMDMARFVHSQKSSTR